MKNYWNSPLRNAVESGSVDRARSAIITHIDDDSRNVAMIALEIADEVAKILPGLYEEDNGRLEIPSVEEWNGAFWNRIKAALGLNFSRDKIELATRVADHLRAKGVAKFQANASDVRLTNPEPKRRVEHVSAEPSSERQGHGYRENNGKKFPWIPILITVGALVAIGVAVCCLKRA